MKQAVCKLIYALLILLPALQLTSCRSGLTGDENLNVAPETFTLVDTIIRSGANRMSSQVAISWWGFDPDGYVTAYEFSFDNAAWYRTVNIAGDVGDHADPEIR